MYFYTIEGYTTETSYTTTLVSDVDDTYVEVYTPTTTQVPLKREITYDEMLELYANGSNCYVSYDDITDENDLNYGHEDVLIDSELYDDIVANHEEENVGSSQLPNYGRLIEFTSIDVQINSIAGNASFITSLNPTKTNYKLVAVVGWSVAGVSTVVPFRLYIGSVSETLYIGLRNTTSTAVTDKTLTVYLMWQIDTINLENLEEEETQEELVGPSEVEEEEEVEDM